MASFRQLKEKRDARSLAVASRHDPTTLIESDISPAASNVAKSSSSSIKAYAPSQRCLDVNSDVLINMTEGKGRGLFWSPSDGRRVGRGTTLLRVTPEVTVASSESLANLCHVCFFSSKHGKPLQRCSGCKVLRYCSTLCQKADWSSHRDECNALQAYKASSKRKEEQSSLSEPGMTVRLLGRLVWERKRRDQDWWKGIETLQSNREAIASDQSLMDLPLRLAHYLGAKPDMEGEAKLMELGMTSASELLDLIGRTIINSFVAYSSDLSAVGLALSNVVAMLNHSCVPNVAVVYPNGPGVKQPMHVVAIRDIEAEEELTTCYIDVADPFAQRQAILQQRYAFECNCPLCLKSKKALVGKRAKVEAREALWCGRPNCTGWVAAPSHGQESSLCTNCKQPSRLDYEVVTSLVQKGKDVLLRVEKLVNQGELEEAFKNAQSTVKELTVLQPPSAYPLLSLLRQLQSACVILATSSINERQALDYFEEAIQLHFVSLAGMQASNGSIYCEGHPSRAIALATLSTLLVRHTSENEAKWAAAKAGTSSFLTRSPSVAPIGPLRDQIGITLMMQAIKELKIAYGIEEEGGEPGRKLIGQVRNWQENEAVMALSKQG